MAEDYYKTLGVRRDASQAEIQNAYRDMARKYHPDVNPDNDDAKRKFQAVQAAYDVLNDQKKRDLYDRYGSSFESMGQGGPRGGASWGGGPAGGFGGPGDESFDFTQFFGERFGAQPGEATAAGPGGFTEFFKQFQQGAGAPPPRGRCARPRRGRDIEHEITVPFTTAITGGKAQISVRRASGKTETITVTIPPGIEDGKRIRLRGQGEPGSEGQPAGDILLTIRVAPHPHFQRRGKHLHVKVPVTLAEAALGAKIDVPTPKGTVSLQVPPCTSSGTKLRVKGHGINGSQGGPGDLFVEIQVVLPKQFDDESRRMLEQIAQRHPQPNPRADLRW
ncbi:MAG TPA: J domain-containing protein [Thermoguttaceae bacterium]|nr:J domain-containing protein [Thermoguttaceae bacterium]